MVQPEERLTARISFYTKPSIDERLDKVVAASPWDKPDWLRHWLEDTLVRLETEELLGEAAPDTDVMDAPLAVQLATGAGTGRGAGTDQWVIERTPGFGGLAEHRIEQETRRGACNGG